jgi:HlyD family secretion protein
MDRKVKRRSPWPRRALWAAPALAAAALGVYFLRGASGRSLSVGVDHITTAPVVRGQFDDFVQVRGQVIPLRTIFVDTSQGGQVEAIHIEDGATVEKGQLLVDLSNTALQLDLISREAQITEQLNNLRGLELAHEQSRLTSRREIVETEYQIDRLTRQMDRAAALVTEGAAPRAELEDGRDELAYQKKRLVVLRESRAAADRLQQAQLVQLRTAAQQLEKNLEVARRNLDTLHVRAPAAGKLSAFGLEVGQSLKPGDRIAQLDDPTRFKLVAELDEFYLGRVDLEQRAEYPVGDRVYPLKVRRIRPQVQDGHFQLELEFTGDLPPDLRRGQTAQTRLQLGQPSEAVLIPNGAFLNDTGGTWLFVVAEGGDHAVRRKVRLGRRNPQYLEVLEGLSPGERIVVSSYSTYKDLDRLELTR